MTQLPEILDLTKKLITVPSVSGDVEKAVAVLELAKKQIPGYAPVPFVAEGIPSLLYSNQGNEVRKFKITLNAHLDVVPAAKEQFDPVEKEGRIYGRGAFDMKGAAAVMILLFRDLSYQLSYPLGLQLTTDEELSGMNGINCQINQGVRTEFAIMGESNSNFRITNQAKGRMYIKVTIKGKTAHAAYPWLGKNAIVEMYQALEPLIRAFPTPDQETNETTIAITQIETNNNATNKIPGICTIFLDVRFAKKDQETILSKIRSFLPSDALIESTELHPPHYSDPNSMYLKQLKKITTDVIGKDLSLRIAPATSEAPHYSKVGCEAVEFGPIGQNPHSDDEWVDIQSLYDYYHILRNFLLHFDNQIASKHTTDAAILDKKTLF